jgi:hypothetical protein
MNVSKQILRRWMALYKEEFDEELNEAEAVEMISRLVALYKLIARPLPSDEPTGPNVRQDAPQRIGFRT